MDDGKIERALDSIAEVSDDIARRRAELSLLESRVGLLQRQNTDIDARWLAFVSKRKPRPADNTADGNDGASRLEVEPALEIPGSSTSGPGVPAERPRADNPASRPPRRGIRAVFARAQMPASADHEPPTPRRKS